MKNNKPKLQETTPETIISTPVLDLLTSKVVCERTDSEKDFYKLSFPDWVNIVAITVEKEILMIQQYRFGSGRVEWEIPGGTVDAGEDPLTAGLRELLEETGYAGENGQIIGAVCPNPAIQDNLCYTVFVENVTKVSSPNFDEMEDIEVQTMPVKEVMSQVRSGVINHGLVLNGLMFYFMFSQKDIFR